MHTHRHIFSEREEMREISGTKYFAIGFIAFATSTTSISAETIDLGLGMTSLGTTLEGSYAASDKLSYRGLYSLGLNRSFDEMQDGVDYNIEGELGGFALIADYRPFGGGFVVGGGLFSSNTSIDLTATVTNQTFGNSANQTGTLTGKAEFSNSIAPMLTLGYQSNLGPIDVRADLGAIFTGGVQLSATSDTIAQADIDLELADTESEVNQYNFFPFLGLSVSYSF